MSKHKSKPPEAVFSNLSNTTPLRIAQLSDLLLDITGGWPKRVHGVLSYQEGDGLGQLTNEAQLFAWIDRHARVIWSRQGPSKKEFFEGLRQNAPTFQWATPYPHYPALPGVLYLRDVPPPAKTGRLDELVARFNPSTAIDAKLLKLAFVTPAAGLLPGKRPGIVVTSGDAPGGKADPARGRGTGKTTVLAAVGALYGGTFGLRSNGNVERAQSDLLSPSAFPLRIVELDNLKSFRFSSEFFESLLTAREFGGHVLYQGHGTRPNYMTFFVTVNGASFSKDMAQRSVVIRLARPKYTAGWWKGVEKLIREHRDEIFADIGWFLTHKRKKLKRLTRWDDWCHQVVSRLDDPDAVIDTILARQGEIDEDDATAEDVVDYFEARIKAHVGNQSVGGKRYYIPSVMAGEWLGQMNRRYEGTASAYLKQLEHPRLRYRRTGTDRGFVWSGRTAGPATGYTTLEYTAGGKGDHAA